MNTASKMLAAATYLYPYADTAKFLHEFSSYAKSGEMLTDMDGHWLTKEGWTQAALDFGLILPSDYPGGAFLPSQPATRLEAAVMIVRHLGWSTPPSSPLRRNCLLPMLPPSPRSCGAMYSRR